MFYGDVSSSSYLDISNIFADFFQITYRQLAGGFSYHFSLGSVCFSNIYSSDEEFVLESLPGLKFTYLPGPDGVPTCILRKCAVVLNDPLTFIFNGLLKASYFPSIWKSSFIIHLYKSGNRFNISNY